MRYFGANPNKDNLGNLQLLGRYAILRNIAEGQCPLIILPGAPPPAPKPPIP